MKYILAAVSFALLASPVLAAERGLPGENAQSDRDVRTEAQSKQRQAERAVQPYNVPDEHKSPW